RMVTATTLWGLVDRRAAETPDRELAVDESRRRLSFAAYRDACERAAAGLAAMGGGEGTYVSWQLPAWLESLVLVGALSRLGAVQNPMLPIYREREMRFITAQLRPRLLVVPSVWRAFGYEAQARAAAQDAPGTEVLVADRHLPDGDPATLPPPPAEPDPADAPVRWVFYTSGTTA